ncbi:MAG: tyrosinase family protein [Paracoccaceae bacterium]
MDTTRRTVLGIAAAATAATALGTFRAAKAQNAGGIAQFNRRDVNTLDPDDPILTTYHDAVKAMRALPEDNPRSWEHQAKIHNRYCPHGNWFFLPWHRAYLAQFEGIIREISGNTDWALPYWDWTRNPQIPAPFWESGSALNHARSANSTTNMPREYVGEDVIEAIMLKSNFEDFASFKASAPYNGTGGGQATLEARPHNRVHGAIGGDMSSYFSPRDAIFWLHHGNIDRIWASWNAGGNANTNDSDLTSFLFSASQRDRDGNVNASQFVGPNGSPIEYTVADLYSTQQMGYAYDRLETTVPNTFIFAAQNLALQSATQEVLGRDINRTVNAGVPLETAITITSALTQSVAETGRVQALSRIAALQPVSLPKLSTATLVARGLKTPKDPDATIRVFLNCDYLTLETPISDPHYVGSAAFFLAGGHAGTGHDHNQGATYRFDLTEAVDALRRSGRTISEQIRPQILAIGADGKGTELAIDGSFELIIKTVG